MELKRIANNAIFIGLLVGFLFPLCAYPVSTTGAPKGIYWNNGIFPVFPDKVLAHVKSLDSFQALLGTPWDEKIPVYINNGTKQVDLDNCNQLSSLESKLYGSVDPMDWPMVTQSVIQCKAMRAMLHVQPAKISYLDHTNVLPLIPDLAKIKLKAHSNEVRTFFSGLNEKIVKRTCYGAKNNCQVETKDDSYSFNLCAAGDFNGDGIKDIILIVSDSPMAGSPTAVFTLGFIMTRTAKGGPLKVQRRLEFPELDTGS